MTKQKVLFMCIHNSARSQMAEELLRKMAGERFDVESAGLEPGTLNPIVVEVLKEEGIDITGKPTNGVFDLFKQGRFYHHVITVCDETSAERCPIFPGVQKITHWSFPDPSQLQETEEQKFIKVREIKEDIRQKIQEWIQTVV